MADERIPLLYDVTRMRPACVLLQAVAGGDRDTLMAEFDASTWLDAPTPAMKLYVGTREQWRTVGRNTARAASTEDDTGGRG